MPSPNFVEELYKAKKITKQGFSFLIGDKNQDSELVIGGYGTEKTRPAP